MVMLCSTVVWTELELYMQFWSDLKKKDHWESSEERKRSNKIIEKEDF